MKNKLILTDVDGVMLNWEWAFQVWMTQHGFSEIPGAEYHYNISEKYNIDETQALKLIDVFNESAAIGFLPALRDAIYYVKQLHEEHGYQFHCITSIGTDPAVVELRKLNLNKLFGSTAFTEITCLPLHSNKVDALSQYKDSGLYWLEDKVRNAETGCNLGLKAILMGHGHNMHYYHQDIPVVKNWEEIYQIIAG